MNKTEFMEKLNAKLSEYGVYDTREILLDFEQHFEDGIAAGETEAQVCEKLGDPIEIAKQYIPEMEAAEENAPKAEAYAESSGFDTNNYNHIPPQQTPPPSYNQQTPPPVYPQQPHFEVDAGKVVAVVLVDLLIFTWALPTLISLVCTLYGVTVAFGGSGIAVFIAGILMSFIDTSAWIFTTLSAVSTTLLGVVLMAATPLLVVASIAATKGIIDIFKHIINWHSMTFTGRKVCTINKKNGEAA